MPEGATVAGLLVPASIAEFDPCMRHRTKFGDRFLPTDAKMSDELSSPKRANYYLRDEPASSNRDAWHRLRDRPVQGRGIKTIGEEWEWNPDR